MVRIARPVGATLLAVHLLCACSLLTDPAKSGGASNGDAVRFEKDDSSAVLQQYFEGGEANRAALRRCMDAAGVEEPLLTRFIFGEGYATQRPIVRRCVGI